MPVNKLTVQEFAQRVKEKYPKYKDIDDSTLTQKVIDKYPEYREHVNIGPVAEYPYLGARAVENPLAAENQAKRQSVVDESANTLKSIFQHPDVTSTLNKMQQDTYEKSQNQTPYFQMTMHNAPPPQGAEENSKVFQEITSPDSPQGRKILEQAKANSTDQNFKKSVDKSAYATDRGAGFNEEVYNKIDKGEYGYDLLAQRPTIDAGGGTAFINGWNRHWESVKRSDLLETGKKEDIINDAESRRLQAQNDRDTPIPKYSNWGNFMNQAGENAIGMTEAGAAAGAIGIGDYLSGGTLHPLLSSALGALIMGRDAGKQAAADTFDARYNQLRDSGVDKDTAYDFAMDDSKTAAKFATATMAAMSFAGFKSGAKPLSGVVYKQGFGKIVETFGKNVIESTKNFSKELAPQLTVIGGMKALENLNAGKPIGDDVVNTVVGAATFMSIIHAFVATPKLFTPRGMFLAKNALANANPEMVESMIDQQVLQGNFKPEQGEQLKADLEAQRILNFGIKDGVSEENKIKIRKLVEKRTALENQLDPEHPTYVDKSEHKNIKEQIEGVKKVNADGTTEGKDGINEQIRQLNQPEKPTDDPVLAKKSNITPEADELLNSLDEGSKPAFITKKLRDIAEANGIEVTDKTKPDDIIEALKAKKAEKINTNETKETEADKTEVLKHPEEEVNPNHTQEPTTLAEEKNPQQPPAEPEQPVQTEVPNPKSRLRQIERVNKERNMKIAEATKPKILPEEEMYVKPSALDPEGNISSEEYSKRIDKQEEIKAKYKEFRDLIDCLWML